MSTHTDWLRKSAKALHAQVPKAVADSISEGNNAAADALDAAERAIREAVNQLERPGALSQQIVYALHLRKILKENFND